MNDSRISRLSQTKVYVGKHFRLFKNEKGWKVLIFAAIISFLISSVLGSSMFVYDMDTLSGSFALISACIWIGIFNSIQIICKERAIIKREHRTGLHISAYVCSHLIFQAFICLIQTVLLLGISSIFLTYPTVSPLVGHIYVEFFITFFLVTYSADVLGLAISSIVKTPATAMTVMPFVLIIQLILSGMLFPLSGAADTISNLTISKWGLRAACSSADYNHLESVEKWKLERTVNEMLKQESIPVSEEKVSEIIDERFSQGTIAAYDHDIKNLRTQWLILIIHTAVYALVSIGALEFVDKDKR